MRTIRIPALLLLAALLNPLPEALAQRRKSKKDEDFTQTLEVLPDPPAWLRVETSRLSFLVAPLSAKGLLSQQVRDGLKWLLSAARGGKVVKIRAFVAGTGDLRRVQAIVSEIFSERRLALPVLSVVQVGGLPLEGAQVQLEATLEARRPANPSGVAFLSGQAATSAEPRPQVKSLAEQSLAALLKAAAAAGARPAEVLRLTCMASSLDDHLAVRQAMLARFPGVPQSLVQTQRAPAQGVVECEAVSRLSKPAGQPVVLINPDGLPVSKNYSQLALVSAPRLILAGTQLAFRYTEEDARLAFQRLEKTLQAAGTSLRQMVMLNTYPLSPLLADMVRKVRFEFLDQSRPPASTLLPFEGLPSMDASFGLEAVALAPTP
jgi:enamine deaminase RidA (YjgF/YER057c/UK114 family)